MSDIDPEGIEANKKMEDMKELHEYKVRDMEKIIETKDEMIERLQKSLVNKYQNNGDTASFGGSFGNPNMDGEFNIGQDLEMENLRQENE
jgi:hypothetical protein